MTNADTYCYEPLDPKSDVRLLILEKGSGTEPVRCRLTWASFLRKPYYEALSYTWGSALNAKTIYIQGCPVTIRNNLFQALSALRRKDAGRILWVDAICIDQDNVLERNHQVSLMKQIYAAATEVLVWLGVEADGSGLAMQQLKMLTQPCGLWKSLNNSTFEALQSLCNRDYWDRMWILQEIALAKRLTIHCGLESVDWKGFENLYAHKYSNNVQEIIASAVSKFPDTPATKLLDLRKGRRRLQSLRLVDLIRDFRDSHCMDPRDKVFALSHLATDCTYKADYSKTMFEVYQDVVNIYYPLIQKTLYTIFNYQSHEAINLSRELLHYLDGPFEVPTNRHKLDVVYRKPQPKRVIIQQLRPTQLNVENSNNGEGMEFTLMTQHLPRLRPMTGELVGTISHTGHLAAWSGFSQPTEHQIKARQREFVFHISRQQLECAIPTNLKASIGYRDPAESRFPSPSDATLNSIKRYHPPSAKELAKINKQKILDEMGGCLGCLPLEFCRPNNLQGVIVGGRSEYCRGIGTFEIMPGDEVWEFPSLFYMVVVRWISGEWTVVGKVVFFHNEDLSIVTPSDRKRWKAEAPSTKLVGQDYNKVELELDIIGLQKLTC